MELKDLVGSHKLTGVDESTESVKLWFWSDELEDCNVINFVLDGVTYTAIEDPNDGYRSSMQELKVSEVVVKNVFEPCDVLGVYRDKGKYGDTDDVLDLFDAVTGLLVLSVGTEDVDDYYPSFLAVFKPENMAVNQGRAQS